MHFDTTIETEHFVLRPMQEGDAAALVAVYATRGFQKYIGGKPLESEILAHIIRAAKENYAKITILNRSTHELVGMIGIHEEYLEEGWDGIQIALRGELQGCGLSREAMEAAIAWHHATTTQPALMATVCISNTPSIRMLKRLGFNQIRVRKPRKFWEDEEEQHVYRLDFAERSGAKKHDEL